MDGRLVLAAQVAEENQERFLGGYAWRALGRVYLAQHREQEARDALATAIALFDALGLANQVAQTRAL